MSMLRRTRKRRTWPGWTALAYPWRRPRCIRGWFRLVRNRLRIVVLERTSTENRHEWLFFGLEFGLNPLNIRPLGSEFEQFKSAGVMATSPTLRLFNTLLATMVAILVGFICVRLQMLVPGEGHLKGSECVRWNRGAYIDSIAFAYGPSYHIFNRVIHTTHIRYII